MTVSRNSGRGEGGGGRGVLFVGVLIKRALLFGGLFRALIVENPHVASTVEASKTNVLVKCGYAIIGLLNVPQNDIGN